MMWKRRRHSTIFAGPMRSSFARTAAAGLVRAGAGLKLPTAVFAVPPSSSPPGRRFGLAFGFGVLGSMAAFAGPWIRFRHTAVDVNQVAS